MCSGKWNAPFHINMGDIKASPINWKKINSLPYNLGVKNIKCYKQSKISAEQASVMAIFI